MAPKADLNKAGWEQSDFPILCETCLGSNPFVRMSKQEYGRSCGTCARPFTVFRWNPGQGARFKTTVICQTCAKVKNVCQTCLLDLQYGLPTQVRDTALNIQSGAPTSDINREYYAQNMESALGPSQSGLDAGRAASAGKEMLKQLARTDPYYKRNKPHLCSFFAKGECKRGDECPYRHETPRDKDDPLAKQNIKDRYHGKEDPVARKIMSAHAATQGLAPPEDQSVTSLFLSALPATSNEQTIRTALHPTLSDPSSIRSIVHVAKTHCAFINFRERAGAEAAAVAWATGLEVDGARVGVRWGRSKPAPTASGSGGGPPPAAVEA